jgi:hypothetical protein
MGRDKSRDMSLMPNAMLKMFGLEDIGKIYISSSLGAIASSGKPAVSTTRPLSTRSVVPSLKQ